MKIDISERVLPALEFCLTISDPILLAAIIMVTRQFEKINQIEQVVDNENLGANLYAMAIAFEEMVIQECPPAEIQTQAATVAAHAIRLLVNYKED